MHKTKKTHIDHKNITTNTTFNATGQAIALHKHGFQPMLSRRALSDVWSGGAGAGGAGAARTERFLHVGQALKLDAVLRGDAPTSLVSMGNITFQITLKSSTAHVIISMFLLVFSRDYLTFTS